MGLSFYATSHAWIVRFLFVGKVNLTHRPLKRADLRATSTHQANFARAGFLRHEPGFAARRKTRCIPDAISNAHKRLLMRREKMLPQRQAHQPLLSHVRHANKAADNLIFVVKIAGYGFLHRATAQHSRRYVEPAVRRLYFQIEMRADRQFFRNSPP